MHKCKGRGRIFKTKNSKMQQIENKKIISPCTNGTKKEKETEFNWLLRHVQNLQIEPFSDFFESTKTF